MSLWSKIFSVGIVLIVAIAILPVANANGFAIKKTRGDDSPVLTPFGIIPRSCAKFVGDNAALVSSIKGIGDTVRISNGKVIHLSPCSESPHPSSSANPCPSGPCDSNWAEYATWCYCGRFPPAILYFDGYWNVPQAPTTNHGQ